MIEKSLETISVQELLIEVKKLETYITNINREITRRQTPEEWKWGFYTVDGWLCFDTIDVAVKAIVEHYNGDFDARHKLEKVYL